MTSCTALVVAAGRGTRLGAPLPKQYLPLGGVAVLRHSIITLLSHPAVNAVRVIIHPDDHAHYAAATTGLDLLPAVAGGAQRQDSVRNGLESLAGDAPERVLIHDGARPFLDHGVIDRVLAGLDALQGSIAALPVRDTVKRGEGTVVAATIDRSALWRAQTPQGFHYPPIAAAHPAAAGAGLSADAA